MLGLAFLIGLVAGLRTMSALAAASWAAHIGALRLDGTWLGFLASSWTAWGMTAFALGELVTDQLPSTPSRTVPLQFGARLASGAVSGGAIGIANGTLLTGAAMGVVGAIVGTLGGHRVRAEISKAFGSDTPAALIEDAVALATAVLIVVALR